MEGTALLIIDVQRAIIGIPAYDAEAVLDRLADLLTRARRAGVPVIHVQHEDADEFKRGTPGWEIDPAVAPWPGEPVIAKTECDSFYNTTLGGELAQRGVKGLVIAGCMTEWCVQTTAKRAVDLGYRVIVAGDGHTTADTEQRTAAQTIVAINRELLEYGAEVRQARSIIFK